MTQIQNNAVTTSISCNDPVNQFLVLLENPRVQAVFEKMIDTRMAQKFDSMLITSELKPIKRIAALETAIGLADFSDLEEDHEPTIPEKIDELAKRIETIETNPQACKTSEVKDFVPENPTDLRLMDIVKHVVNFKKEVLTGKEMDKILLKSIEAEKKPKKLSNLRMAKKCVLSRAVEVFPFFKIGKSIYGNHRLRLEVTDNKALSDYAIKHGMHKCQKA